MSNVHHSTEWAIISKRNREEIEKHRLELEALNVTPERAHQLRGMIFALNEQTEHFGNTPDPIVKDVNYG